MSFREYLFILPFTHMHKYLLYALLERIEFYQGILAESQVP